MEAAAKSPSEWQTEVTTEPGASNVSSSSILDIGDGFHELTGTTSTSRTANSVQ